MEPITTSSRLFNYTGAGSRELETLTGQWYASSPFRLIETEIVFAEREVERLAGPGVFARAVQAYSQVPLPPEDLPLLDAVRLPVACLALLRHSALTGVSHESTGRKVKMDDNERSPFAWQIDRDDRAMQERYYRALDAMYSYLEESAQPDWTSGETRRLCADSIVKTIGQFEAVYPVDGSYYVYYMLLPLVIEQQRSVLEPRAGAKWAAIADGSAPEAQLALARRAAILGAVITAGLRWSLEVFPLEIARRFSPTFQGNRANRAAMTEEIDWYVGKLKEEKENALNDLTELLADGTAIAPKAIPQNDPANKFFTTE